MNINFPDIEQNYIKNMIDSGYYSTADDLVGDAVRLLREQYDIKKNNLMTALNNGEQDIKLDKTVPYSDSFLDNCENMARKNITQGKKPNSDVCA